MAELNRQASPAKKARKKFMREIKELPQEKQRPFNSLERKTPLTSSLGVFDSKKVSGVPQTRQPINKRSKKQGRREYQDAKLRKDLHVESDGFCAICGLNPATEDSHNRAKSKDTLLRHERLNHLLVCHSCHEWWRANPAQAYQLLIDRFPEAAEFLNAEAWRDLALWKSQPVQDLRRAA